MALNIEIAVGNGNTFIDSTIGDVTFCTTRSDQRFLFGTNSSNQASMVLNDTSIVAKRELQMNSNAVVLGTTKLQGSTDNSVELRAQDNSLGGLTAGRITIGESSNAVILESVSGVFRAIDNNNNTILDTRNISAQVPGLSNNIGNLYVQAGSNFGINTSTPTSLLHVAGDARVDGDLYIGQNKTMTYSKIQLTRPTVIGGTVNVTNTVSVIPGLDPQALAYTFSLSNAQTGYSFLNSNGTTLASVSSMGTLTASNLVITGSASFLNAVTMPYTIQNAVPTFKYFGNINNITVGGVAKYTEKVFDTTSSYSTSTGIYTAPISGLYFISANLRTLSGTSITFSILKVSSGVTTTEAWANANAANDVRLNVHSLIQLLAGDQVSANYSLGGGAVSLQSGSGGADANKVYFTGYMIAAI